MTKSTILVIDDEQDLLALTKTFLETEGFEVHAFKSPEAAVSHARSGCTTCTVVVSDIRMPGMSGFEVVRRLRELLPNARVVLMSSFVIHKEEFRKVLPSLDVDEFLMKPFTKDELVTAVRKVMRNSVA